MLNRSRLTVAFASALLLGCASVQPRADVSTKSGVRHETAGPRELSPAEQVTHVLSRLTFGARPGDVERVAAMGVDRWIDEQLHPARLADSALTLALAPLPAWSKPATSLEAAASLSPVIRLVPNITAAMMRDTNAKAAVLDSLKKRVANLAVNFLNPGDAFASGKIIRAEVSDRQLQEVIADFWENHFSVYTGKLPGRGALLIMEREAVRPYALGKFRDLLGAVAHSPAMLHYLDNAVSRVGFINENYGRELLELHTLGVDGGYTQADVIAVSRALTGWTFTQTPASDTPIAQRPNVPPIFSFNPAMHDSGSKTVLGHILKAGRGIEDGEEVLDILARHPSTAHHIADKLARRLVSDDPAPALVDRAAETFMRTDGDIAEVVRTIVTSPEFFSHAAFRAKVKTPFEFIVSARRALGAPADSTSATVALIRGMGLPMYGRLTPDGWPDRGSDWINAGAMYSRITFSTNVATGKIPTIPVSSWTGWTLLVSETPANQVDGIIHLLLGGIASPATRDALTAIATEPSSSSTAGSDRIRDMIALTLGSPDFQRR